LHRTQTIGSIEKGLADSLDSELSYLKGTVSAMKIAASPLVICVVKFPRNGYKIIQILRPKINVLKGKTVFCEKT
jgi:hypothetical protein